MVRGNYQRSTRYIFQRFIIKLDLIKRFLNQSLKYVYSVIYIQNRVRFKKACRDRRLVLYEKYWDKVLFGYIIRLSVEMDLTKTKTVTNKFVSINKDVKRYLLERFEDQAKLIRFK
jgi:hypothetical protein